MTTQPELLLRHVRGLVPPAGENDLADGELLRRFARGQEDAFAALVGRHGPMVLGVCRRVVGDAAEDVAQATFLALARRAGSIRRPEALAAWLHETARNLALKYRRGENRRRLREARGSCATPCPDPLDEASARELLAIFDEEVQQLPECYRLPLILCALEGCTQDEAARRLGWTPGSVKGRLERGRALLHQRLARRGLMLPAALAALGVAAVGSAEAVTRGSLGEAVGELAGEALAEGGTTTLARAKVALAVLLAAGVVAAGVLSGRAPREPAAAAPPAAEAPALRVDRHGDPLPPGALARLGTLRWRAPSYVNALAFAPDGKTLAAATNSGLCLFDLSGRIVQRVRAADTSFARLAFAPGGVRLICRGTIQQNGRDSTVVQIWGLPDGRKQQEFDVGAAEWVGWSAEGDPLAVVLTKEAVVFRELAAGKERRFEVRDLPNPAHRIFVCDYNPAAKLLAATTLHGVIHVWDVATGKKRRTIETKTDGVLSVALAPDGRRLAWIERTGNKEAEVRLVDLSADAPARGVAAGQRYLRSVTFSPDGKTLVTTGWIDVRFWDAATARERGRTKGVSSFSPRVAFSPDSKTLVTAEDYSRAIHQWDVATGSLRAEPTGHTTWPGVIDFSPDGRRVATGGGVGSSVFVWNPTTGEPLHRFSQGGWARSCAFSADGRTLFTCWTGHELKILDAGTMQVLHTMSLADPSRPELEESGLGMQLADDRKTLVAFSDSRSKQEETERERSLLILGWDAATREHLFRRRRSQVHFGFAVSPDLRVLAVSQDIASKDSDLPGGRPVRLEDLRTGQHLLSLPQLETQTHPVWFSPDGRLLATNTYGPLPANLGGRPGQRGQILRLWEWQTAGEILAFSVSKNVRIAFSSNGCLMALSAAGGEILVWDLRRGKEHVRFKGFDADVTSLAFSPDGRRLISGLSDTTLLVWHVPPAVKAAPLDAASAGRARADLAADARKAFAARGMLAGSPEQAVALLKERLKPVAPADPAELRRLIAPLDSDRFAARDEARRRLEELGDRAAAALREALAKKPGLETQRRVEALLARLRGPIADAQTLQAVRAVAVLEDINTSESKKILDSLTTGAPGARLTEEAKAALGRLARR
jgi:RNA polymerase sigma factor (sigma-70 family)